MQDYEGAYRKAKYFNEEMTRHRFSNGTVPNRMSFEWNKTAIRKTEAFHAQGKLSTTHATRPTEKQELRQGLILQPRHTALRHSAQPRLNDKIISSTVYTHSREGALPMFILQRGSKIKSCLPLEKHLPPKRGAVFGSNVRVTSITKS